MSLKDLAAETPLRKVTWREGTKGKLSGHFAWLRVWPGGGWATGDCAGAEPIWLLIEEQADGKLKYAFRNLPAETTRLRAVRLWKSRWPVEQGYQQMKEELGLDHFEGRSWRGFHHHVCLVMLAFGFLALEQLREKEAPASRGKKGVSAAGHPPGDPSRLAAVAEPEGQAGLHLLQPAYSCFWPEEPHFLTEYTKYRSQQLRTGIGRASQPFYRGFRGSSIAGSGTKR